jgi:hypothetical protein
MSSAQSRDILRKMGGFFAPLKNAALRKCNRRARVFLNTKWLPAAAAAKMKWGEIAFSLFSHFRLVRLKFLCGNLSKKILTLISVSETAFKFEICLVDH